MINNVAELKKFIYSEFDESYFETEEQIRIFVSSIIEELSTENCFGGILPLTATLEDKTHYIMAGMTSKIINKLKNVKTLKFTKKDNTAYIVVADDSPSSQDIKYLEHLFKGKELEIVPHSKINDYLKNVFDLVLFTGGEDVTPSYYLEEKGRYTHNNERRDEIESNIFKLFKNTPKLGICRGAQFLTVCSGGSLIQDVEGHNTSHNIVINTNVLNKNNIVPSIFSIKTIESTSSHHQMMFPYNMKKDDYVIIGYSEYFKSSRYLNGKNENIKLPIGFVEPEIVYYPKTNSFCVQGHPEWCKPEDNFFKATIQLINKTILNNEK